MSKLDAGPDWLSGAYTRLSHPDPSQLMFQLQEIVGRETYLQNGIALRPGATVLDVGANVGVAAAFFADHGAAAVHCFEPIGPIRTILERNVDSLEECIVHPYGLSSRAGRASITYYPNADAMSGLFADPDQDAALAAQCMRNLGGHAAAAANAVRGRYRAETLTCDLRTLSAVMEEERIGRVDLLKIDVERAELDVLLGIEERDWPGIQQVVVEIHDQADRVDRILELVRDRGFSAIVEQDSAMAGTDIHMLYARRKSD